MWRPLMAALVSAVAALAGTAPAASADHGITLLASQRLDSRLLDLTLSTPALGTPTHVRVLLPARYREQKPRRYPVLYLLHGSFDDYRSWTQGRRREHHRTSQADRGDA
ncbi:MAG: hypothetical protein WB866_03190 [Solirubrobacterales bacterium]